MLGLVLGVVQSFKQKYTGAMKWHYVTGLVFGVFTATWAFSGLLSMEPFEWTNSEPLEVSRSVFGRSDRPRQLQPMKPAEWDHLVDGRGIKEIELARIQDEHYYMVRLAHDPEADKRPERLHQPCTTSPDAPRPIACWCGRTRCKCGARRSAPSRSSRAAPELPDVPIVEQQMLTECDAYLLAPASDPLPVLRVKFADPGETWFYIDPSNSTMLSQVTRLSRIERWLYNGLHSSTSRSGATCVRPGTS